MNASFAGALLLISLISFSSKSIFERSSSWNSTFEKYCLLSLSIFVNCIEHLPERIFSHNSQVDKTLKREFYIILSNV